MDGDASLAPVLRNVDEAARARPIGDVLAELPWEGDAEVLDAARTPAARFLEYLVARDDG